jgi:bla regulator protein BlaR1
MKQQLPRKLSFGRKLKLSAPAVAVVAGPIVFGLMTAPETRAQSPAVTSTAPAFEVVSIKPNHGAMGNVMVRMAPGGRFVAENVTPKFLLEEAYGVKDSQILGAPGWLDSERYDVEAKAEDSSADDKQKPGPEEQRTQLRLMLQSMLADRFKLTLHHETKELPVYALVVAKNGPKLHETADTPGDSAPPGPMGPPGGTTPRGRIMMNGRGELTVNGVALARFADVLSRQIGHIVVDKTGLTGNYDFTLKWTPDEGPGMMPGGAGGGGDGRPRDAAPPPDASGPTIFTALQEQLGLKLESQKGPVDSLVIDHVERPSEN